MLTVLLGAAEGRFPPADGGVTYLPPLDGGWEAIVSLTGHAFVASRLAEDDLADLSPDGFGAVLRPELLLRLAGSGGSVGMTDVTLVATGRGERTLDPSPSLGGHPRVAYARSIRREVSVYGSTDGLFTMGEGLAGRLEMSVETSGNGVVRGRDLIESALSLAPRGEPLFAAVSPGNARSLRAFLACGFTPLGSEVLIRPRTG